MADQRVARAEQLAALGRDAEVLEMLADPALIDDPNSARMRVFALLNLERSKEAHNEADRLVALDPDSPLSFLARSYAWEAINRPWESLRDARVAVGLAPGATVLHSRLATCLARTGQLDEAHEEVGWVLSQEPDNADHWVLLGRVYYHLNRFDDARGALLEALRLDAENTEAKVLMAGVQVESQSDRSVSINSLIDVLKDNPSETNVRTMLMEIAFPQKFPRELLLVTMILAVMVGPVLAVPLGLFYGAFIAYRYWRLPTQLKTLVMADPASRRRVRIAIVIWTLALLVGIAIGIRIIL